MLGWEKHFDNKLLVHYVSQFTNNTLPSQRPLPPVNTLDAFLRMLGLLDQSIPAAVHVPPVRKGIRQGWNAMCWVQPNVVAVLNNMGRKLIEIRHLTNAKHNRTIDIQGAVGNAEFIACIGEKLYITDCVRRCVWVLNLVSGEVLGKIGPDLRGGISLEQPHGIAVWEERKLLVADTSQGCIFIIDDEGEAKIFAQACMPVSVSVSRDGHVAVATSHVSPEGEASVYGPNGTRIFHIKFGSRHVNALALHPEDSHQLYLGFHASHSIERYERTPREARKYALMGSFETRDTIAILVQREMDTRRVLLYALDGMTGDISAYQPWGHAC